MVTGQPVCPQCDTPVETHWEWCHQCGYDPERKRPAAAPPLLSQSSARAEPRRSGDLLADGAGAAAPPLPTFDPPAYGSAPGAAADAPAFGAVPGPVFEALAFGDPEVPAFGGVPEAGGGAEPAGGPLGLPAGSLLGGGGLPAPRLSDLPPPPPPPPGPAGKGRAPAQPAPPGLRPLGAPGAGRIPGDVRRRSLPHLTVPPVVIRVAAGAVVGVLALAGLSALLVRVGGEPGAVTSTTIDPSAPPPIGQLQLGARTTTTTAAPLAEGWVRYQAPDGTFSAVFPSPPTARGYQRVSGTVTQNGLEVFLQAGADGPVYSVAYVDLLTGASFADSKDFVDQALAGDYDDAGPFEVAPGLPGEAIARRPGAGPASRGFVLLKGRRVYIVESLDAPDADLHQFVVGFRWLGDPVG